jgi:hypothetical protein
MLFVLALFCQACAIKLLFFFIATRVDDMSSALNFLEKKFRQCVIWFDQISIIMMARKSWLKFFDPKTSFLTFFFYPKHLWNRYKNQKIIPKTKINSKPKINLSSNLFLLPWTLKIWKPDMNSSHQMKLFDTNLDCFGSLNYCQRYFFSTTGIQ